MFSTGFSSGERDGSRMMVRFLGTLSWSVLCHPARSIRTTPWALTAIHTPLADKVGLHKLEAGDSASLLALIHRITKKAERTMGGPVAVLSCYEAGYDGFWLHRVLAEAGIINHVIDPASLQVNRRARRAKTDRIDAMGENGGAIIPH